MSTVQPAGPGSACGTGQAWRFAVGLYSTVICNETAWTYRMLYHGYTEMLTPLGFTQTVAHLRVPPNSSLSRWPPLKRVVQPIVPVNKSAANGFVGTGHGGEQVARVCSTRLEYV